MKNAECETKKKRNFFSLLLLPFPLKYLNSLLHGILKQPSFKFLPLI
jgi:hypothetical protein